MKSALAIVLAYGMLAGSFFLATRTEADLIDIRDTAFAAIGFPVASDTLAIHTGEDDCWPTDRDRWEAMANAKIEKAERRSPANPNGRFDYGD